MATTCYFEETIVDQDGKAKLDVEFGRSSFYAGSPLENGQTGEDSIYLTVDGTSVLMDLATAQRFVDAVMNVGAYHGLVKTGG